MVTMKALKTIKNCNFKHHPTKQVTVILNDRKTDFHAGTALQAHRTAAVATI